MNKNILKKFKRASAGALAAAVIALGTSCGYVPAVETTATTGTTAPIVTEPTVTDKVTIADIENIKPVYNENIVEPEMIEANNKLNATIKKMINENKYYGNNFTYLVERLTITNISVEAYNAEEEVNTDYAPTNKAKVTITYDADVVDKQTAEKSTVTNTISYVVEDVNVASLATSGIENADYTQATTIIATATEEKLEEIETTGTQATEEDEVTSRQSIITGRLSQIIYTDKVLNDLYNTEYLKKYIDAGYDLISMFDFKQDTTTKMNLYSYKTGSAEQIFFNTTDCGFWINKRKNGEFLYTINYNFVTLAINNETGDKRLIIQRIPYGGYFTEEKYNEMKQEVLQYAYFDPYALLQQDIEAKQGTGQDGYWGGIICGSEPYTEKFYSDVQYLIDNYPFFQASEPLFDYDIAVEDINNYEDAKRVMTLTDENNTNVYIKEASNELDK